MSDEDPERYEASGGWRLPERPATDELVGVFRENHVTFRSRSGGFDVFLDGRENVDVHRAAARRGYEVEGVTVTDGPFNAKLRLGHKSTVRIANDGQEHTHRVGDDE